MHTIQMFEASRGFFFIVCENNLKESYASDLDIATFLKISLNNYLDRLAKFGGSVYVKKYSYFDISKKDVSYYINEFKNEFVAELILAEMESDNSVR